MISGKTQIAAAAAVIALSASVSAAPTPEVILEARGAGMSRIAKTGGEVAMDIAHRKAVGAANDKINEHFGLNKPHVPHGLAEAARIANKPHDPKLVAAATSHGRKKRDLEEAIDELIARSGIVNRVTGKIAEVGMDIAHRKAVGAANDKINGHIGKPHVPQGLVDAAKKHSQPHDPKLVAAAIGKKKRELEDELDELFARGAGMSRIAKVGGDAAMDMAHRKAVGAANDRINDHFGLNKPHVHSGLAEAARKHNQPHDSKILAAALGKKKRELEEELEELFARGAGMSRIAKTGGEVAMDLAHRKAVGAANDKINEHFGLNKPHVPHGLAEAARIANKPHDPKLVAAALGHKKRELEDELEELIARGAGMSRIAKTGGDVAFDLAHRKAVGAAHDKINDHFGLNKPHVPHGLAEAARIANKPHDPKLVAAVTGHKKRDFEDDFEELFARGAGMSRIAKTGGEVAMDLAHRKAVGAANDKINEHFGLNKPHIPHGLAEAARIANKPHDPKLVAAALGHKKRDFEDEFDELIARGAGMSKIAKIGGEAAMDIAHRKAVGAANDKINDHFGLNKPHVPHGLAEAARKHNQPHDPKLVAAAIGHTQRRKRDLAAALMEYIEARSFELDDLE